MEDYLILPSIGVLAIKILIVWQADSKCYRQASPWIWVAFASFFWLNLVEAAGLAYFIDNPQHAFALFISYYIALISAGFSLMLLSIEIPGRLSDLLLKSICVCWGVVCILIIVPDFVIADVKSNGYSLTKVEGKAYFIAQAGIVLPFLVAAIVQIFTMIFGEEERIRKLSKTLFFSTGLITLTVLVVMAIMASGSDWNMTVVLSFATLISMSILIYSEHTLGGFRFIPTNQKEEESIKNSARTRGKVSLNDVANPIMDMHEALGSDIKGTLKIVKIIITHKTVEDCGGNKSIAADHLGISLTTVRRRLKEYQKLLISGDLDLDKGRAARALVEDLESADFKTNPKFDMF